MTWTEDMTDMTGSDNITDKDPMTGTRSLLHDVDRRHDRRGQMNNMSGSENITYEHTMTGAQRDKNMTEADDITYEHPMTGAW